MIAIVDYGRGNLGSVRKALAQVGGSPSDVVITDDHRTVERAAALVVPGDGAFADAMRSLERLGLIDPIRAHIESGRPYLGICLGYQLLFTESEEFGHAKGLDILPGVVRRFRGSLKVPHMGWNQLQHPGDIPILAGVPDGAYFYFVHSYYPELSPELERRPPGRGVQGGTTGGAGHPEGRRPEASRRDGGWDSPPVKIATCEYGVTFPALVAGGKLYGTQFHPEKSQRWGLRLLANFAALVTGGVGGVPA